MAEIRIGISGWNYPPWRGNFYPRGLPQKFELAYASRRFNALEINGTFYSLQRPSSFRAWHESTPLDFVFAVKGPRYLTHMLKLKEPLKPLANFFASGLLALREKLGPILWQFPPNLTFNEERFRAFLDLLPGDTKSAARLGKQHDAKVKGRAFLEVDKNRPIRHAIEFRHETFLTERFLSLLRENGIALVVADVASKYPTAEDVTADWVYVRLHGSRQLYASGYSRREIAAWSSKIQAWHQGGEPPDVRRIGLNAQTAKSGRDIFVFFDNTDVKQRAPVDARQMAKILKIGPSASVTQVLSGLNVKPKARQ